MMFNILANLKKNIKHGKDINKLLDVVDKLATKEKLEPKYKDHQLVNDEIYNNCRECHIEPDWLLVYKYNENELILLLINTGSHNEVF
jgi:mRNA interferase YafQ